MKGNYGMFKSLLFSNQDLLRCPREVFLLIFLTLASTKGVDEIFFVREKRILHIPGQHKCIVGQSEL